MITNKITFSKTLGMITLIIGLIRMQDVSLFNSSLLKAFDLGDDTNTDFAMNQTC